jgi:heat-inducible transcriptional repressor
VQVSIGEENPHEGLRAASVVSTGYGLDGVGTFASLGIVGPTRMDYPGAMGAVRAVARYVGHMLAEG